MIPRAFITAWRSRAPWPNDGQVEQDLVLSRVLVELFSDSPLAAGLALRGGTALHKLHFEETGRYSEDIDLVQVHPGPIGPLLDGVRAVLDPWLGEPGRRLAAGTATLTYRFESTTLPVQPLKLKVEINTREHFTVYGYRRVEHLVNNPWFSGRAELVTYELEELLATKLRALYQRRKGRDLYDLWLALTALAVDDERLLACFRRYLSKEGASLSRAEFEENLAAKLRSRDFLLDVMPLIRERETYDSHEAMRVVVVRLVSRLEGDPWKGVGQALEAFADSEPRKAQGG